MIHLNPAKEFSREAEFFECVSLFDYVLCLNMCSEKLMVNKEHQHLSFSILCFLWFIFGLRLE